jgi:hypothetical protein
MYTVRNFKSKKELKEAVANGERIEVYQPGGIFSGPRDGSVALEGPHYPQPHRWYASCRIKDGMIVPGTIK